MIADIDGIGMTSQRTRERLINRLYSQGISNILVLEVMRTMPRHIFLDEALAHRAYEDTSLPIGYKQTLSQPYIVAKMTELLLSGKKMRKVLEIGTGSGYQCAVLAKLVGKVYSIERIEPLLSAARDRFEMLGLENIETHFGDGGLGWDAKAPFDGIIATAAPSLVPQALLNQLAPNGVLIAPVEGQNFQDLRMITRKGKSDKFDEKSVEAVKFVPMLSGVVN